MTTNKKKVLLVQYSQTGQLSRVSESFIGPLRESPLVDVTVLNIEPVQAYPFPWGFFDFLNVFPESVYLDPPEIKPLDVDENEDFDLVILAYTAWFLSPSLPITAFLKHPSAKKLLHNKPVITLIACRDMWAMSQETIKQLLETLNARLIDNVALIDQGSTKSFITTPRWMFTGRKNSFWGLPEAGIAEQEITNTRRFGLALVSALKDHKEQQGEALLMGLKAVSVDISVVQSEKIGYRSFRIWGKLLRKVGQQNDAKRKPVLLIYFAFLICMIVTVVPISIILKRILSPFLVNKHVQMKEYYELPSGSGVERMSEFPVSVTQ